MLSHEQRASSRFGFSPRDEFLCFFWEPGEQEDDHGKAAWEQVQKNLVRVRGVLESEVTPASVETIDREGYLAAIQQLFPSVTTFTTARHRGEINEDDPTEVYNRLMPLYLFHNEDYLEDDERRKKPFPYPNPTGWGFHAMVVTSGRVEEWERWSATTEVAMKLFLKNSLPKIGEGEEEFFLADFWEEWGQEELAGKIQGFICERIEYDGDIWNTNHEWYYGFDPFVSDDPLVSHLALHAAAAAYCNKPEAFEKIFTLLRFVAATPGELSKDGTTWTAYVAE